MEEEFVAAVETAFYGQIDEQRRAANAFLDKLREENFGDFLRLVGSGVVDASRPRIQNACIIIIMNQARTNENIRQPELVANFWVPLFGQLPQLLASTSLPSHMKLNVINAFVNVAVADFGRGQTTFQGRLLEMFSQNRSQEEFYVYAISSMMNAAKSFCGFQAENILQILKCPKQPGVPFVPRVALYFATLKVTGGEPVVLELFGSILENIAQEELSKAINIMIDFCGECGMLLRPVLTPFLTYICQQAKTGEDSSRNAALILMQTLLSSVHLWFAGDADAQRQVFTYLISIISEVNDSDPLLMENEELQLCPYVVAAETLRTITANLEGQTVARTFHQVAMEIMEKESGSWTAVFGVMAAYAYVSRDIYFELHDAFNTGSDMDTLRFNILRLGRFMKPIVDLVFNTSAMPRLRVVALQAMNNFYVSPGFVGQHDRLSDCLLRDPEVQQVLEMNDAIFPGLLRLISQEKDQTIIYLLISVICNLIAQYGPSGRSEAHPILQEYFQPLMEMMLNGIAATEGSPAIHVTFLGGLGTLGRAFARGNAELFGIIANTFSKYVMDGYPIGTRVKAIYQFTLIFECLGPEAKNDENVVKASLLFLTAAVRLFKMNLGDTDQQKIDEAIYHLMTSLNEKCSGVVQELAPLVLQGAGTELDITTLQEMSEDRNESGSSLLITLQSKVPGFRQYVLRSEAQRVADCFHLLPAVFVCCPQSRRDIICRTFDLMKHWLVDFGYCVPPIDTKVFDCLLWFCRAYKTRARQFLKAGFDIFIGHMKPDATPPVIAAAVKVVTCCLSILPNIPVDLLRQILEKTTELSSRIIAIADKEIAERQAIVGEVDETAKVLVFTTDQLMSIAHLYDEALEANKELSSSFFVDKLRPTIDPFLARPVLRFFAISLYASYFQATGDLQKLIDLLPYIRQQTIEVPEDGDMKEQIFWLLHKICSKWHPLPPDLARQLYALLRDSISQESMACDSTTLAADAGLIALSCLIRTNFETFRPDLDTVIPEWNEFLPIWEKEDEAEDVYALCADFIECGHTFYFQPTEAPTLIPRLIRQMIPKASPLVAARLRNYIRTINAQQHASIEEVVKDWETKPVVIEALRAITETPLEPVPLPEGHQ